MFKTINSAVNNSIKYRGLLKQLIIRDIKLKYRRSVLGYLWSILNPLMIMLVMTIVFSNFFRFTINNYPVYLLCGQIIFNSFSTSTSASCLTIIQNGSLLKKTYVPKYIFVFSKITSNFVDFLFNLVALLIVMIFTKSQFSIFNLIFIIPFIELYIFSLGMGLLLSQATVFFRDIQYLYSVLLTALNYLTPIFYPIDIIPNGIRNIITRFNPLYLYVTQFRACIYSGEMIDSHLMISGFIWSVCTFIIGVITFKSKQDKFILYI